MKDQWFVFLLLVLLFSTNRFYNLQDDKDFISYAGPDSFHYLSIAKFSPQLAPTELNIPYHHAQRGGMPYLLGLLAKWCGINEEQVLKWFCYSLILVISLLLLRVFKNSGLRGNELKLFLAMYILNPYALRYYIAISYLINDVLFIFSVTLVILALQEKRQYLLLLGLLIASMARQTALPFMFFPALWVALFWKNKKPLLIGIFLIPIVIYSLMGIWAQKFSLKSINMDTLTGLYIWAKSYFHKGVLAEFLVRAFIPLVFSFVLLVCLFKKINKLFWVYLFGALAIFAQPVLGGPIITGQNVTRLIALGLLPFLLAVNQVIKTNINKYFLFALLLILFVSSLHHMYSLTSHFIILKPLDFAKYYFALSGIFSLLILINRFKKNY